jgi:hypothetical protein
MNASGGGQPPIPKLSDAWGLQASTRAGRFAAVVLLQWRLRAIGKWHLGGAGYSRREQGFNVDADVLAFPF